MFISIVNSLLVEIYIYIGCGRKNTPIWEGHNFGWGGRTMVESMSSNSSVRTVFNAYHGVVGRTTSFFCSGVYKKWRVAGSNTACFSIRFVLGRREAVPDKKRFIIGYQTLDKQDKLWKLWRRRYDRKLLPLHLKWFSGSWKTTERGYISLSIFKAATWVMFCSKHIDVKQYYMCFPEIEKTFLYPLWFWIYSLLK